MIGAWPPPKLSSSLLGAAALVLAGLLGGCASTPSPSPRNAAAVPPVKAQKPARPGEDSGPADPPPHLAATPDAEPRIEPIRPSGPNKPYSVLGKRYVPLTSDVDWQERGLASWYGAKFHGRLTSSGEPYNMYAMTAAHRTLPLPSYARVRNVANGREVIVRINDRGPFHGDRILDLSYTAALKLGLLGRGSAAVELERITHAEIRSGAWKQRGAQSTRPAADAVATARASHEPKAPARQSALAAPAPPRIVRVSMPVSAHPAPVAEPTAAGLLDAAPTPAEPAVIDVTPRPGFWVQLGTFSQRQGAEEFRKNASSELDGLAPLLAVFAEEASYKIQAGPYTSRDEARIVAGQVREILKLVPLIIERR